MAGRISAGYFKKVKRSGQYVRRALARPRPPSRPGKSASNPPPPLCALSSPRSSRNCAPYAPGTTAPAWPEDRLHRFRKALDPIYAANKNVSSTAILQFGQHVPPKLGSCRIGHPHAQHLFPPAHGDPHTTLHRHLHHRPIVPDFTPERVKIDNRINLLQGSILPPLHSGAHRIGHLRNQTRRCLRKSPTSPLRFPASSDPANTGC
jgi:hypothetical protein